ncbi:MAG: ComEC/Rec2 family competence protein [Steroidobacteraceae bacterium]
MRELWHAQWVVAVALLPVTAAAFGTLSWAGLALNLVAIPLCGGVLVPLVLAGVAASALGEAWARPLFTLAARLVDAAAPVLQAVADRDAALWHLAPPAWWYPLAAAVLPLALLPWRPRLRFVAVLALAPAIWPPALGPARGELALTLLDAGRGLAVIARTQHHALVYDLGEAYGTDGAVTSRTVLPALRALQVARVDRLLVPRLTRARSDGVAALLAALPVAELQAGEAGPVPPEYRPAGRARPGTGTACISSCSPPANACCVRPWPAGRPCCSPANWSPRRSASSCAGASGPRRSCSCRATARPAARSPRSGPRPAPAWRWWPIRRLARPGAASRPRSPPGGTPEPWCASRAWRGPSGCG